MHGAGSDRVYTIVHVDDCLIFGTRAHVENVKKTIASLFEVKDMGPATFFLGLQITRNRDEKFI
jgi:Reverse transcriptase (RNA-dependent DNA polymerase)